MTVFVAVLNACWCVTGRLIGHCRTATRCCTAVTAWTIASQKVWRLIFRLVFHDAIFTWVLYSFWYKVILWLSVFYLLCLAVSRETEAVVLPDAATSIFVKLYLKPTISFPLCHVFLLSSFIFIMHQHSYMNARCDNVFCVMSLYKFDDVSVCCSSTANLLVVFSVLFICWSLVVMENRMILHIRWYPDPFLILLCSWNVQA